MPTSDPRVDAYIERSGDFAKPILSHLRQIVHETCPDVVEEIKWGVPHFNYKGMFAGMAAFKSYCTFGFWKGELVVPGVPVSGMGQFGRLTKVSELPSKSALKRYVKKAMALNDAGIKVERRPSKPKKPLRVPPALIGALKARKGASAKFDAFSPSHKREYVEWITEAKTDETRNRRLATAVDWIATGKSRNWKYER